MNMKEIVLGDYTVTPGSFMLGYYDIYLHNKKIGWVVFLNDMSLRRICTNDTDLITLLLLRYQVSPYFEIYPFGK